MGLEDPINHLIRIPKIKNLFYSAVLLSLTASQGLVYANNNNMSSSLVPAPTIVNPVGSSGVELFSGSIRANYTVYPISGFTRSQCNISLSGVPTKSDGGYKRSRHYSFFSQSNGTGWRLRAAQRSIQDNRLRYVSNTTIQYQIVCAN